MSASQGAVKTYYLPEPSRWPIIGACSLLLSARKTRTKAAVSRFLPRANFPLRLDFIPIRMPDSYRDFFGKLHSHHAKGMTYSKTETATNVERSAE